MYRIRFKRRKNFIVAKWSETLRNCQARSFCGTRWFYTDGPVPGHVNSTLLNQYLADMLWKKVTHE